MTAELPKPDVMAKVSQVFRDMNEDVLYKVVNAHGEEIWAHYVAQEFLHQLMKGGDWYVCYHPRSKAPPDEA